MKYKKIDNPGLGLCHILKENRYGYLIYSEKNKLHFIITSEIKDDSFILNRYYGDLDNCLKEFNELGENIDE